MVREDGAREDGVKEEGGRESWFSWVGGICYSVHAERVLRGEFPSTLPVERFMGQHLSKATQLVGL